MKQGSTSLLRAAISIIGLVVAALCIFVLPLGIASDETGGYRWILLGLYIPAVPFFVALYQALMLLRFIDGNEAFSKASVGALKNIRRCATVITGLFIAGMPYIYTVADRDDAPGVVAIALIIIFASFVIATFAHLLQRLMQSAVDMKTENDLTV